MLCAKIDAAAMGRHAEHITVSPFMAMVYLEKFAQANAINGMGREAANALTDAQLRFPLVAASIGIDGTTLWDVAQVVIQKYLEWCHMAGGVETVRLGAKKAIRESASVEAANAAYEAAKWTA